MAIANWFSFSFRSFICSNLTIFVHNHHNRKERYSIYLSESVNKIFLKIFSLFLKSELLPLPPKMPFKIAISLFHNLEEIFNKFPLFSEKSCWKTTYDVFSQLANWKFDMDFCFILMRHTSFNPLLAKIGAKYDKIEFVDFFTQCFGWTRTSKN